MRAETLLLLLLLWPVAGGGKCCCRRRWFGRRRGRRWRKRREGLHACVKAVVLVELDVPFGDVGDGYGVKMIGVVGA